MEKESKIRLISKLCYLLVKDICYGKFDMLYQNMQKTKRFCFVESAVRQHVQHKLDSVMY